MGAMACVVLVEWFCGLGVVAFICFWIQSLWVDLYLAAEGAGRSALACLCQRNGLTTGAVGRFSPAETNRVKPTADASCFRYFRQGSFATNFGTLVAMLRIVSSLSVRCCLIFL